MENEQITKDDYTPSAALMRRIDNQAAEEAAEDTLKQLVQGNKKADQERVEKEANEEYN